MTVLADPEEQRMLVGVTLDEPVRLDQAGGSKP
jgi:hypothetical protein